MGEQCVSSRVAGRFQRRCFLLLKCLMRDSQWFKTESVLCALVALVRYGQQSPTRDLEPPYLLPCALSHYCLLLILVFCEGLFLFCSFSFLFFLSFLHSARLFRNASFFPGGGIRSQQASRHHGQLRLKIFLIRLLDRTLRLNFDRDGQYIQR